MLSLWLGTSDPISDIGLSEGALCSAILRPVAGVPAAPRFQNIDFLPDVTPDETNYTIMQSLPYMGGRRNKNCAVTSLASLAKKR